jgi:hypothetical protein
LGPDLAAMARTGSLEWLRQARDAPDLVGAASTSDGAHTQILHPWMGSADLSIDFSFFCFLFDY